MLDLGDGEGPDTKREPPLALGRFHRIHPGHLLAEGLDERRGDQRSDFRQRSPVVLPERYLLPAKRLESGNKKTDLALRSCRVPK